MLQGKSLRHYGGMGPTDLYNKSAELGLQFTEGYDGGTGSVTFNSRKAGSPPTFYSYTLTRVMRAATLDKELLSKGIISVIGQTWHIPQQSLDNATATNGGPIPAPAPKPDDTIVDQVNATFVVNDGGVESQTFNGYPIEFICFTQKAVG